MNVGAAITRLLDERGLEPRDLRKGTGLSSAYISQLMTNKQKDVSLKKAMLIADYFDIPLEQLVEYSLEPGD